MRFRASIINADTLLRLIQAVEKMDKKCFLRLSERKFEVILQTEITEGVYVLGAVPVPQVFADVKIESKTNNIICLETNLELMARALKSSTTATGVVVKLIKREVPYLSIIADQSTSQKMSVAFDVPVEVLSPERMAQLREPGDFDPEIYTLMPPLRTLRPVIEHMKNIGPYLKIRANMSGELDFRVDADLMSVATHFRNLEHPHIQGREPPRPDPNKLLEVTVDCNKFHKFLFSAVVNPQNVVLCLNINNPVVIHVMHDDVYLTYFLPVIQAD